MYSDEKVQQANAKEEYSHHKEKGVDNIPLSCSTKTKHCVNPYSIAHQQEPESFDDQGPVGVIMRFLVKCNESMHKASATEEANDKHTANFSHGLQDGYYTFDTDCSKPVSTQRVKELNPPTDDHSCQQLMAAAANSYSMHHETQKH